MIRLSEQIELLARRLADAQHVTVEETVRLALEARAREAQLALEPGRPRDPSAEAVAARRVGTSRIVHEIAAMPVLDARSAQEIMDDLNGA
jgi:hypothetical protein